MPNNLATYFDIPQQNSNSPEAGFYAMDNEYGPSQIPRTILTEYLNSQDNIVDGKPNEGLIRGLTRAANVGRYDLITNVYFSTEFGSLEEAFSGIPGPYTSASNNIADANRTNVMQRRDHAFLSANVLETARIVANRQASSDVLIPVDNEQGILVVKTFLENDGGSLEIGKALKNLSDLDDERAHDYIHKFKQTAANVIAQGRDAINNIPVSSTHLHSNGKEQVVYEMKIPYAGSVDVYSGPTPDTVNTLIDQGKTHFNEGFRYTVDTKAAAQFFTFKPKLWIEKNALGNIFANQAELEAAVEAARQKPQAPQAEHPIPLHVAQQAAAAVDKSSVLAPNTAVNPAVGHIKSSQANTR